MIAICTEFGDLVRWDLPTPSWSPFWYDFSIFVMYIVNLKKKYKLIREKFWKLFWKIIKLPSILRLYHTNDIDTIPMLIQQEIRQMEWVDFCQKVPQIQFLVSFSKLAYFHDPK